MHVTFELQPVAGPLSRLLLSALITFVITPAGLPLDTRAAGSPGALWETFAVGSGILSGNVFAIVPDGDGAVWFGTEAGVSRYDGRWSALTVSDGLPGDSVRAIARTMDGALWFATQVGLARRSPEGDCCDRWTTERGLPANDLHTLTAAAASPFGGEGRGVWVGTSKGMAYVEGDQVIVDTPVPDGDIVASLAGPNGELFVGVKDSGVWRHNGRAWQRLDDGSLRLAARAQR